MRRLVKVASIVLAAVLSANAAGACIEIVILFDLTGSMHAVVEDNKTSVEIFLRGGLPVNSCVTILGITEASFSNPEVLVKRSCIPSPQYMVDTQPQTAAERVLNLWAGMLPHLNATRRRTDVFGALSLASLLFSQRAAADRRLLIWSDMRQDTQGLNFSDCNEISVDTLKVLREKRWLADLSGVRTWILGVHTRGKDQKYFYSLQSFWQGYFRDAGARLESFSPSSEWSGWPQTVQLVYTAQ